MNVALQKMTVKKWIGVFMIGFMMLPIFTKQASSSEKQKYGGTLRIGSQWNILPLDPFHTNETLSVHMLDLVFNKLVRLNSNGEMEPDLATKWEISDDGKTYTFHLRDEVYFHNKTPFSSKDVMASYQLYVSPETKSPSGSIFKNVESVTAPDDRTVVFQLKESYAPFLFELKDFYIISAGSIDEAGGKLFAKFGKHPIGTGPFQFSSWEGEKKIVLKQYPFYHEGRPYLDQIILQSYNSVPETWAALMRGEADMMLYLNREDFDVLKKDPTFQTFSVPSSPFYYALAYNHNNPLLADKRFRLAMAHAINRKEIIDRAMGGYGTECTGPFLPGSWAENKNVKPIPYDPQKALELLAEMGWKKNDKGILEKEGKELSLSFIYFEGIDIRGRVALVLRQYLQEIGIKLNFESIRNIEEIGNAKLKAGNFDIELRLLKSHPEPSLAITDWDSLSGNLPRYYHYQNGHLDSLIREASHKTKKAERKLIFSEAHKLIYEEQPYTFLFFQNDFYSVKRGFQEISPFFTFYTPFYTLKNWAQEQTSAR